MMCKYLMLNIPIEDKTKYSEIESLDEVADILGWSADGQKGVDYDFDFEKQEGVEYDIDPETEFWGHCSNLQAWYENDYDTRLLHSNLSFPLLKALNEVGDPIARRVFKEELEKRIKSGYPTVIECIVKPNLSDYLNIEDLKHLIEQNFLVILTAIEKLPYDSKLDVLYNLISLTKEAELLERKFPMILESIDKLPDEGRHHVFSKLLELIEGAHVLSSKFPSFLESVNKLSDQEKQKSIFDLIDAIKVTDVLTNHFPSFLESIDVLSNEAKYEIIPHLIYSINNTELLDRYSSQIDSKFLVMLQNIDKCSWGLFYELFNLSKDCGWMEEHFLTYLEIINKLSEPDFRSEFFSDLLNIAIKRGWLEDYFPTFFDVIDRTGDESLIGDFYSNFIIGGPFDGEESRWMKEHFILFLETIDKLSGHLKQVAFEYLIISAEDSGWLETLFLFLVDKVDNIPVKKHIKAYLILSKFIKGSSWENIFEKWKERNDYSSIE